MNKRIVPITIYFESREFALHRMKESYTSELHNFSFYDVQSRNEADNNEAKKTD